MIDQVIIQPIADEIGRYRKRGQDLETLEVSRGTIWLISNRPGSKGWDGKNFEGVRVVEDNGLALGAYRLTEKGAS